MRAQQHQYLSAMGVQVWQLRGQASTAVELGESFPPEPESQSSIGVEIVQQPAQPASTPLEVDASVKEQPVEPPSQTVEQEPIPEFRLASLILSDSLMVVTEVPGDAAEALHEQAFQLLKSTLWAQGVQMNAEPITTFFNWPILRNPNFDQSEQAARQGCRAFINGQQTRHQVTSVILLGELVGRYALSPFKDFAASAGRQMTEGDTNLLLTHALLDVCEKPALKAEVWRHLEPLRLSLEQ